MRKKGTWLTKHWLHEWEKLSTPARWQKGRTVYQQNLILDMHVKEREITSTVKGGEGYRQRITCKELEKGKMREIREAILKNPSLVMLIYFKSIDKEMVQEPLRSLFFHYDLSFTCSCHDEVVPCKHLVGLSMAYASEMERSPERYVMFRGIPWQGILQSVEPQESQYEKGSRVNYSLVPLPSQKLTVTKKKMSTPPFWVSPFPFSLMMEEIYSKVREELEKNEGSF